MFRVVTTRERRVTLSNRIAIENTYEKEIKAILANSTMTQDTCIIEKPVYDTLATERSADCEAI